ncbi:hypothetical protein ACFSTD_19690 [Novosphingobium colocasiae]
MCIPDIDETVRMAARALGRNGLAHAYGHCSMRIDADSFMVCAALPMGGDRGSARHGGAHTRGAAARRAGRSAGPSADLCAAPGRERHLPFDAAGAHGTIDLRDCPGGPPRHRCVFCRGSGAVERSAPVAR